jgi:hypothetical protein
MNKKIIVSIVLFSAIFAAIAINYSAPSLACVSTNIAWNKNHD